MAGKIYQTQRPSKEYIETMLKRGAEVRLKQSGRLFGTEYSKESNKDLSLNKK